MIDISFHITDIFQNSVAAAATEVRVRVQQIEGGYEFSVADNGCGMPLQKVADVKVAVISVGQRHGLGIPLLRQSVEQCGGNLSIDSSEGIGTKIVARFMACSPRELGDLSNTLMLLIVGNPNVEVWLHLVGREYEWETSSSDFMLVAGGVPISHPFVAKLIGEVLDKKVAKIFGLQNLR